MADKVTNYKCPACTGPLHFSGASGKLECDYCGSKFDVEEIEALYAEDEKKAAEAFEEEEKKHEEEAENSAAEENEEENAFNAEGDWDTSNLNSDWGADAEGMKVYSCPSCGAELMCDETTAATSCPYCGNPTIVPGQFSGMLKPDYIIPFKYEKKQAVEALKNHYKGKFLLPSNFTNANHIEEIKGVYVPFWLFSAKVDADVKFHATTSFAHIDGDYEVIDTSHYSVRRGGTVSFNQIPADASKQMPDDYMDSIEPFDYSEMKKFSTAYMPGYLADKYDVSATDSAERADRRCANSAVEIMRDDVSGYETVSEVHRDISLHRGAVEYAMLPVWVLTTKWNDKNYLFMMNGQTGKLVGELPISKGKYWGLRIVLVVIITLICAFSGIGGAIASWIL